MSVISYAFWYRDHILKSEFACGRHLLLSPPATQHNTSHIERGLDRRSVILALPSAQFSTLGNRLMKALLLCVFAAMALGGCSPTYQNPGKTEADFEQDSAACKEAARKYVRENRATIEPIWRENEAFRQYRICMARGGYTRY